MVNVLSKRFPLHLVDGKCSEKQLIERIKGELKYQSDLELINEALEPISELPLASEIIVENTLNEGKCENKDD